jgi:predicted glycosyltransferase
LYGFTDANKIRAVKRFSEFAKVFISTEKEIPKALEPYLIKIPPEKMHDVLAHATLFFGESATMASESAVLGTPAIYLQENWLGYTDEEEAFGLLFSYKQCPEDQNRSIEKGIELLRESNLNQKMRANRKKFLQNKIDVTAFFVWFLENYPRSVKIMRENPDYQYRFKSTPQRNTLRCHK